MIVRLARIFGVDKPVIAMVHLPALPGRPRHDRAAGMGPVVDTVARGTSLKYGGVTWNAVDPDRAARFMDAARAARQQAAAG